MYICIYNNKKMKKKKKQMAIIKCKMRAVTTPKS